MKKLYRSNLVKNPLSAEDGIENAPIQAVLIDCAAQENCDSEEYDLMVLAADYIDSLEKRLDNFYLIRELKKKT